MKRIVSWVLALATAALFLSPLLWMLRGAFLPESAVFSGAGGSWTLENFGQAWRRADLGRALVNSLIQVAGILGIGLFLNSMAAFAFSRLQFRGRDLLFSGVVALILLPVEVLVIPLFLTAGDVGLLQAGSHAALILPFTVKAMNIFFLRQAMVSLPDDTEEAALLDGAGWFRIYWSVTLPAVRPALATVIALDVITHWSDFIWPLVVCTREETRTVQIALANLFTRPPVQWGDILACSVLLTLPVLLIFRFLQRFVVCSDAQSGGKE